MRIILLHIIILAFGCYSQQEVAYTVFNETNSSIGSDVNYDVHQTPDGIVYVSGNNGIQRFDGKNFYSYAKEGKGIAISSSQHDHSGRLWANTFHGDIYYLENDSLIRHPISDQINGLSKFYRLSSGFYIVTRYKVFCLDENKLKFHVEDLSPSPIMSVNSVDGQDYCFNFKNKIFIDLAEFKTGQLKKEFLNLSDCIPVNVGDDSYTYHKVENLLYNVRSAIEGTSIDTMSLPYKGKVNFADYIDGHFYICGMNGIRVYDRNGILLHDILPKVQVSRVIKDFEGNLLVSTVSHGLILITDLSIKNFKYDNYLDEERIIRSAIGPGDVIYLGTNAGLVLRHDLSFNKIDTVRLSKRSEITALYYDTIRDHLFVFSDRLFVVHKKSLQILKEFRTSAIKQVCSNRSHVAVGSRSRILKLHADSLEKIKETGWSISLTNYDSNSFIISTKKGLFHIDNDFSISEINFDGSDHFENIQIIRRSKSGRIFFLNNNEEIYEMKGLEEKPELIYSQSSRVIQSIDIVEEGIMSIEKDGVKLVDPDSGRLLKMINHLNGLSELNTINVFELKGRFVFSHNRSISIFEDLPDKTGVTPAIHLLNINGSFKKEKGEIHSQYNANLLSVNLHVSNVIRSQGTYQIKYRIKGVTESWSPIFSTNDLYEFARLPIGRQVIQFQAFNEYDVSSEIEVIEVKVLPPFYLSNWFVLLMIGVVILLIIFVVRYFVKRAKKRLNERLKQQRLETRAMNAELTAIRSQMNPHFIFNVLTAIQSKVIEGDTDEAYDNIGDFAKLIRNVLDKSGKAFLLLKEELGLIKNYVKLENTRFDPPIDLVISINDEPFFEDVEIPTLITQPFVENAIKHAFSKSPRDRRIEINVDRLPSGFYIEIKDNGTGIEYTKEDNKNHKSFAMDAMNRRIENLKKISKYNVDLEIESDSSGTNIKLVFTWKRN